MKIKKLKVYNFRQIDYKEYSFKDGINVISGPNESGKTTLFYIIISALFDNPKKIRKSLLDSYKSWGKEEYPVIDFTLEKDSIEYIFHKDFNNKTVTLNGENIDNLDKLMMDLISIDRVVFEKLSCVYQNQIASIEQDSKTLEKSILDILSSTSMNGINVLDAISKVSKKIQNMKLGLDHVSKNIGIIKTLDIEILALSEKLDLAKEDFKSFSSKSSDLEKLKKEKSDMEKKFEENRIFLDKVKKARDLNILNNDITSKMKEIDAKITRLNKLYLDLDGVKRKFSLKEFENMNTIQNELSTLRNNIDIREKDLSEVIKKKDEVDNMDLKAIRKNSPVVVIVSILLLIITVISVFFGYYLLISIFIDIIFVGIYLRFVDYNRLETFKNPAIESINQIENEIKGYKASMSSILAAFNVSSIDDFFRKKTHLLSLKEELLKLESTIKGILGTDTLASLESAISDLSIQKRDINTEFSEDLKDFVSVDPILLNKKRIENEELDLDLFTLNEDIIALESRVSDNKLSLSDLEDMESAIQSKKEERVFYTRRVKILEIVEENLKKAKSDAIDEISVDINKLGSEWIGKITKGKYSKIDIVNNDKLSIIDSKHNRVLSSSDFLSTGLMDQVYLLSRLSILNIVLKDKSNIMMFDDPFINFDKERLSITIDLLKYFSKFNQIFLFTCHNFFDSIS